MVVAAVQFVVVADWCFIVLDYVIDLILFLQFLLTILLCGL